MRTGAALLAAGGGSRFRGPTHKLLAEVDGVRVVDRALAGLLESGIVPLAVVVGAVDLDPLPPDVEVLANASWSSGIASSLAVAVDWARGRQLDALVVGLGDQPFVPAAAWRKVAAVDAPIAVATYEQRRANPVRLAASVWDLLPTAGDEGARRLMARHPELVEEVPCPGSPADIDTVEELDRWS